MKRAGIAAVVVAIAVVAAVAAWPGKAHKHLRGGGDQPRHAASASSLAEDSWSELPTAPIPAREGASMAWAGDEMLVWGGQSGPHGATLHGDGAAYSPSSRAWRVLPSPPFGGRVEQSSVWTGNEWIVWGGYDALSTSTFHVADSGAAYDPRSNSWRALSPSPLAARDLATAVWTGKEAIFLGGMPAVISDTVHRYFDGTAYDPASDRWRTLPALPAVAGHDVANPPVAVWAGDRMLVWWEWSAGSGILGPATTGFDLFSYDPGADRWQVVPQGPDAAKGVGAPVWTGHDLIIPAAAQPLPGSGGGPQSGLAGSRYDPAANTWHPIAHGPIDDTLGPSLWTGGALVRLSESLNGDILPGDGAVWDPATDRWARLPRTIDSPPSDAVWTGSELLLWGRTDRGLRFGAASAATQGSLIDSAKASATCEAGSRSGGAAPESKLVAAFDSTAGEVTGWERARNGPSGPFAEGTLAARSPAGTYMAVCYFDGGTYAPSLPPGAEPPVYNRVRIEATVNDAASDGIGCFHSASCGVGHGELDVQRPF